MSCSDTSASASHVVAGVFRRMSPTEKLAAVEQMSNETRELARCGIAARHPEYSIAEVEQALFRLLVGDELANRAWPAFAHIRP